MSTVKISELALINQLNANTSNTLFVAVDVPTGVTGKFTGHTLAQGLYSNEILNVGANPVIYPGVVAQFSGNSTPTTTYLQVNFQNFTSNGSTDFVASTSDSTNANSFIDMGISGKDYSDPTYYSAFKPYDGYVYVGGPTATSYSGNLILGTASSKANIVFMVGGTMTENVVGYITNNGYNLLSNVSVRGVLSTTTGLKFADGSTQNTASNPAAFSQASFDKSNSAITLGQSAYAQANAAYNQANSAITLGQSGYSQANTATTTGQAAFTKANNALANTTGTFAGDLTLTGSVIAVGIQSTTGAITTGNLIVNGTTNISGIVSMNAQVVLTNGTFSNTQSALTISATANVATPSNDGYMIHISGKQNVASRIVSDSYGANTYVVYAGRTARGNVTNPSAVQTNDILSRFSGNGYGTTGWSQFGSARIDFVASENYTDAARGSQIQFWNCPIGSNTLTQIATFNGTSVLFTGEVNPQKGLVLTPNVLSGITTTLNIDIANSSLYRFTTNATTTINLSGFKTGKIVEVWLTNTDTGGGSNHTITHGCLANNSTIGATSFTLSSLHSAYIKYFSIGGDIGNTFCQITYS